jgi:putative flippase GtrA
VVGGLAFLGDVAFVLGMAILWASAASFVVGSVINYLLSIRLVFLAGRFGRSMEVGSFLAVALIGLGLTTTLMYMLTGWARGANSVYLI